MTTNTSRGSLLRFPGARGAVTQYVNELSSIYGSHDRIDDPDIALAHDYAIYDKVKRDPVIASAIHMREHSVAGTEWHLEPGGDTDKDKAAALICEELVRQIRKFAQSRLELARAVLVGRTYSYVRGRRNRAVRGETTAQDWWTPYRMTDIDKRRIIFKPEKEHHDGAHATVNVVPQMWSVANRRFDPIQESANRALVRVVYQDREDRLGHGEGLIAPVYYYFWAKEVVWKRGLQYLQRWARGMLAAKVNQDREGDTDKTNEQIADEWLEVFDRMAEGGTFVYGEGEEVNFFEASGKGHEMALDFMKYCDESIYRLLTGSVRPGGMATEGGGARAQADIEQDTSDILIQYDRGQIDDALTDWLVRLVWNQNRAQFAAVGLGGASMPKFTTVKERREDPAELVNLVVAGVQGGIEFSKREVYERIGWKQPEEGEEVIKAPEPAQPPGGGGLPFDSGRGAHFAAPKRCPDGTIMPKSGDCTGHEGAEGEGGVESASAHATYGSIQPGSVIDLGGSRAKVLSATPDGEKVRLDMEVTKKDGSKRSMSITKGAGDKTPPVLPQADLSASYAPEQMDRREAVAAVKEGVRDEALEGWFRKEDKNFKPEITDALNESPKLRDAALNLMHLHVQTLAGREVPFDEFLQSDVVLYRAGKPSDADGRDTFASFTPDRSIAEKFGDDVERIRLKPSETYGSLTTTAEAEVLVPTDKAISTERFSFFLAQMARLAALPPHLRDAELALFAEGRFAFPFHPNETSERKKPKRCPDGTIMPKSGDCTGHEGADADGEGGATSDATESVAAVDPFEQLLATTTPEAKAATAKDKEQRVADIQGKIDGVREQKVALQAKVDEIQAEIEEWKGRKYKTANKSVLVREPGMSGTRKALDVDWINERRRQNQINGLDADRKLAMLDLAGLTLQETSHEIDLANEMGRPLSGDASKRHDEARKFIEDMKKRQARGEFRSTP